MVQTHRDVPLRGVEMRRLQKREGFSERALLVSIVILLMLAITEHFRLFPH